MNSALTNIAIKIKSSGLCQANWSDLSYALYNYEGITDLFFMWQQEDDLNEKKEIMKTINELIYDCNRYKDHKE